jgi:phosphoribosylformylglycinamidine synthase subunit PurS
MKVTVTVTLKNGVLDPQGAAMEGTLKHLGFDGVSDVRVGKHITLNIEAANRELAEAQARAMCEALLANTVIESYRVELA